MVAAYEAITGETVHPASPERLFIQWVAAIILQQRAIINFVGNQNLPSRATGANLDALGIMTIKKKARSFSYRHFQGFNTVIIQI